MGKWTIVITGVTGQLGSYLAEYYLEKDFRVVGFSRRVSVHSTGRIDHLMDNPDFVYLEGDVTDPTFLFNLLNKEKPDYLVNTAAMSHVGSSFSGSVSSFNITAEGAVNVIDAVLAVSPHTRVVHMSTSEMFGSSYSEYANANPDQEPVYPIGKFQNENTRLVPQSPYAIAKLAAHHYVRLMRETEGGHFSSLIAFNFESQRRGDKFVTQKIVKWFKEYKSWLTGREFGASRLIVPGDIKYPIDDYLHYGSTFDKKDYYPKLRLGNLKSHRDWQHAKDVVKAIDLMLQADIPDDYVVGSGETRTVEEFLRIVCKKILGDDNYMKYVVIDKDLFRPAEVDYLRSDPSKIKSTLGWTPEHSFEDLVEDMCNG